jgi:anti-sigma regulatory factor (Ser/Thr protein kinase)
VHGGSGGSNTGLLAGRERAAPRGVEHLLHEAFLYDGVEDYIAGIRRLVLDGVESDEPVLVAVPEPRLGLLRKAFSRFGGDVRFLDMRRRGRNPGRILPLIRSFADEHRGHRVRFIGECIWPERTPAAMVEGHRHEALVNIGLEGCNAHVVCPYDTGGLEWPVVSEALRTHPCIVAGGEQRESKLFTNPMTMYAAEGHPLTEPPAGTVTIGLHEGLAGLRREIEQRMARELARPRVAELVVAANEAVANTIRHAGGEGTARMWREDGRVVIEIADHGVIDDPFVGRRLPDPLGESGRGVWLMNQLCDLVELRSSPDSGTVVRLHMSFD